jgi:hypothetical protein
VGSFELACWDNQSQASLFSPHKRQLSICAWVSTPKYGQTVAIFHFSLIFIKINDLISQVPVDPD